MGKKIIFSLIIIVLAFSIVGCKETTDTISQSSVKVAHEPDFEIYLIKDIKSLKELHADIDNLTIESQPIITEEDIESYDWDNHSIRLKKDLSNKGISEIEGSGTPFLVVVEKERIYAGAFWSLASSYLPDFPTMSVLDKTLKIFRGYPLENSNESLDPRNDIRIYNALIKTGKLK